MTLEVDVVVVGGGPAGAAAATCCATAGLRVALVEREVPRERPGETLHAVAEQLFEHLGVRDRLLSRNFVRAHGSWIDWNGAPRFIRYENVGGEPTPGFQVPGEALDAILIDRAREVGVDVREQVDALRPIVENGSVCGVDTGDGAIRARFTIDAGGRRQWLARRLDLPVDRTSSQLLAHFGYVAGKCPPLDDAPMFRADSDGWYWIARVGPSRYHWTRLSWRRPEQTPSCPRELAELELVGRIRAIDVTWRCVNQAAGPGYWCVGDAAAVVDPAGSHGVIRALIAGITVGESCAAIVSGGESEAEAQSRYGAWVKDGFARDTADLRVKYRAIDPSW